MGFIVQVAGIKHLDYAEDICKMIEQAALARGTGIAKRDPAYIEKKVRAGDAVIALSDEGKLAGFCYIETWDNKKYVVNSGLIVNSQFRNQGLAKRIKKKAFELSRKKYPGTKLFGITTSMAVMKINSELGYKPVTFSELTSDDAFWNGCQSCPNYDILTRNNRKNCLCTGMLYEPSKREIKKKQNGGRLKQIEKYHRWVRLKQVSFLKKLKKKSQTA